ncbi:MAG TPA: serine/threonine-protein kinase [Gammaproteobacteria bacterium]|jgi:serine/threonine protein kinase
MAQPEPQPGFDSTFHTLPAQPEVIGKYEILEEVGRGSMGTVYSAHDPFSDRTVAVKVANPQKLGAGQDGARFRKLFFNEAHAAGVLEHPSILTLFDAGVDGDLCYLVMEYVPGARTLHPFCRSDNLLPVREVVGIVYKCAKALDYAHRQGIIHRDIKPSNILFTQDRDIRVSDFSIARITRADATSTQFDGFLGSPLYMSPEQINEWEVNSNTDIFSLGTVTYELLTGNHPFRADTLTTIATKITNEKPVSVLEYRSDIPEGIDYILGRMMKKKSSKRYAAGIDLAADLALIFDDLEKIESEDALRRKFQTLKELGFFRGFNDAEIWELVRASNWQTYPPDSVIIREGDLDDSFYILLSGVVTIQKSGQHVDSLQEGDCFGEMGFLARTERTATVVAKTDVSLIKVNAATLDRANEATQLRFLKVFVRTVVERLKQTTSILTQLRQI